MVRSCEMSASENHSAVEHVTNNVGGPNRLIIHLMSIPNKQFFGSPDIGQ